MDTGCWRALCPIAIGSKGGAAGYSRAPSRWNRMTSLARAAAGGWGVGSVRAERNQLIEFKMHHMQFCMLPEWISLLSRIFVIKRSSSQNRSDWIIHESFQSFLKNDSPTHWTELISAGPIRISWKREVWPSGTGFIQSILFIFHPNNMNFSIVHCKYKLFLSPKLLFVWLILAVNCKIKLNWMH